eukprot:5338763-Pyramimonas_sp.AAC.1
MGTRACGDPALLGEPAGDAVPARGSGKPNDLAMHDGALDSPLGGGQPGASDAFSEVDAEVAGLGLCPDGEASLLNGSGEVRGVAHGAA